MCLKRPVAGHAALSCDWLTAALPSSSPLLCDEKMHELCILLGSLHPRHSSCASRHLLVIASIFSPPFSFSSSVSPSRVESNKCRTARRAPIIPSHHSPLLRVQLLRAGWHAAYPKSCGKSHRSAWECGQHAGSSLLRHTNQFPRA